MSNLFSHLLISFLLFSSLFSSLAFLCLLSLLVRLLKSHSIILTSSFFLSSTYFLNSINLWFKFFFIQTGTMFHYFLFNSTIIVMIPFLFYFSVSFYFYPCPYFQYHSFHSFLFLPSGPCISHLYPLDMKFLTFFHSFYLFTSHIISHLSAPHKTLPPYMATP